MIQKVLLISGRKQSGKSSLRNYLIGKTLVDNNIIETFNISTKGELLVPTENSQTLACLDLNQQSPDFYQYALWNIWPFVKNYSFADELKRMCINLFDVDYIQCYGTDEDKNSDTSIIWEQVAGSIPVKTWGAIKAQGIDQDFMTARELMEFLGTKVLRKIKDDCWARATKKQIIKEQVPFVIVDDARFKNEVTIFDDGNFDVYKVRLLRCPFPSTDIPSENDLDDHEEMFDLAIPDDVNILDKQDMVVEALIKKGWMT